MLSEEIQLLFGEYAAGRISPAGRKKLFEAALQDQALFDAIAQQEEIRELMLLPETQSKRFPFRPWFSARTALGAIAVAVLAGVFLWRGELGETAPKASVPTEIAASRPESAEVREAPASEAAAPRDRSARKSAPQVMSAPAEADEIRPMITREAPEPSFEILKQQPDGTLLRVSSQEEFAAGDRLQLRYVVTVSGTVELVDQANGRRLFSQRAAAGDIVSIPLTAASGRIDLALRTIPADAAAPPVLHIDLRVR